MKLNRIMGLVISGIAALIAGIIAMHLVSHDSVKKEDVIDKPSINLVNILVANNDVAIGMRVTKNDMKWIAIPEENVLAFTGLINDVGRPDAMEELDGLMARMPILKGDPIRAEKLVGGIHGEGGTLASLLPQGKRAVSLDISTSTAAGGMILPNDHVDIMTVHSSGDKNTRAEVILRNIRVLTIDQNVGEENQMSFIGTTATLELTDKQSQILVAAQSMGARLILALRSASDAIRSTTDDDLSSSFGGEITIIKSGVIVRNDGEELAR
ncbi:MAG: Flp pilus assembly protein CpaB [Candidatus Liberibacter europaeus]|uniref:Flp pilus assembly protein CpaB n=1 Tax=Candidatus Liberibacter europaeus TaxID=744859 RepID=A0A2T4VXI8_9HYPH|nr:MAG: Flp pilus assembly protein CpaB [Candidatus Liberibacter europaeus]